MYAQPLVSNGVLLVNTEDNNAYGFSTADQTKGWTRNLGDTFDAADLLGCPDIKPNVGITSTPVVDAATNTEYLTSKAYLNGSTTVGYYLHALNVTSGAERPGFPVQIQGNADNDPSVTFNAETELQRPGLLLMNGVVYAAFGGHCDRKPFQGWVVGVSTYVTAAATPKVTTLWSDETGPNAQAGDGPGGGIWQAGSGLVSDASGDIVLASGNGTVPPVGAGTDVPGTLAQSIVRLRVQSDGSLKAVDHFSPYNAAVLNQSDSDVGSGGPVALPPQYFGTKEHPRLIVTAGKEGVMWLNDATDLGGVAQGPQGADKVVSRVSLSNGGVRGKPGIWPGDGGYVYVVGSQSGAGTGRLLGYKYSLDGTGTPTLALAGRSADLFGFGAGSPVVTSDGTVAGSALVWTVWFPSSGGGVGAQLRAYKAVPAVVGGTPTMTLVRSFPLGTGTKFSVPAVDNNRLYVATADGHVLTFGAPVQTSLTGPGLSYATTTVQSSRNSTATVTAHGTVTITGVSSDNPAFVVGTPVTPLPVTLTDGQTWSVPVLFKPSVPGQVAGTLSFATDSGTAAITLTGTGQAKAAQLTQNLSSLSFGGVVAGRDAITETVTFSNTGAGPLQITGYKLPAPPYTVTGLPAVGATLKAGDNFSASFTFTPTAVGLATDTFGIQTDDPAADGQPGHAGTVNLSGSGGSQPALVITPMARDYGNVTVGTSATQSFTVANTGGTNLNITISKPPSGAFAATTALEEATVIAPGTSLTETVRFSPTATGTQTSTWAISGDDASGRRTVSFTGTGVPVSTPPVQPPPVQPPPVQPPPVQPPPVQQPPVQPPPARKPPVVNPPVQTPPIVKPPVVSPPVQKPPVVAPLVVRGGGQYHSVKPARILDTRIGKGAARAAVAAHGTVHLAVLGRAGVPFSKVSAVVLNVSVTGATAAGNLTVYRDGSARPGTATAYFPKAGTVSNLVIAPVGADGKVALTNNGSGRTQLTADVAGYFAAGTPASPGAFGLAGPARLLDTRVGVGAAKRAVPAHATVSLTVLGRGAVPRRGVSTVVLNVTAISPRGNGTVVVYPHGTPRPLAANLSYRTGQTVANLVVARVGADGKVAITNNSNSPLQLTADVTGYFLAGGPASSGFLTARSPARLVDTRAGIGSASRALPAHATIQLRVLGRGGVPRSAVAAVVLNITVPGPLAAGIVVVYRADLPRPAGATLTFSAGGTATNAVVTQVGLNGAVSITNNSNEPIQLIADIEGYFNT